MYNPKPVVFSILDSVEVEGVTKPTVYQERPEVLTVFPCIVFSVPSDLPIYTTDKKMSQNIEIKVDIYAETSVETGLLLSAIETAMIDSDMPMTFSGDVKDPEGLSHKTSRFNLLI